VTPTQSCLQCHQPIARIYQSTLVFIQHSTLLQTKTMISSACCRVVRPVRASEITSLTAQTTKDQSPSASLSTSMSCCSATTILCHMYRRTVNTMRMNVFTSRSAQSCRPMCMGLMDTSALLCARLTVTLMRAFARHASTA
jgi:hypothetical protein